MSGFGRGSYFAGQGYHNSHYGPGGGRLPSNEGRGGGRGRGGWQAGGAPGWPRAGGQKRSYSDATQSSYFKSSMLEEPWRGLKEKLVAQGALPREVLDVSYAFASSASNASSSTPAAAMSNPPLPPAPAPHSRPAPSLPPPLHPSAHTVDFTNIDVDVQFERNIHDDNTHIHGHTHNHAVPHDHAHIPSTSHVHPNVSTHTAHEHMGHTVDHTNIDIDDVYERAIGTPGHPHIHKHAGHSAHPPAASRVHDSAEIDI